jgi:hypothetical protein
MNPNPYQPSQIDSALPAQPPVLAALVGEDGGMSIEFEIEREDLVEFTLFHHQHSSVSRTQRRRKMLVLAFALVLLLGFLVRYALPMPDFWFIVLLIAGLLVSYPRIQEWQLRTMVERMYGEGRNLLLYGPRRVALTPQFLNNASPHSQSVTRWLGVEKLVVAERALYIYISSVSSIVIPRRAFSSDDHFQTFFHTAQEFHAQALAAENPRQTTA